MPEKASGAKGVPRSSVTSPKSCALTVSGPSATLSCATRPVTSPVPYRMLKRLPLLL